MDIIPIAERQTMRGPKDKFTGSVWVDRIVVTETPSRLRAYNVSFEPGARTAWHAHPYGQVLYIVSGVCRVQKEGEPVRTATAGTAVWIKPNEKHWHGAAPGHSMIHLAMQEGLDDGSDSTWFGHVTDSEYNAPSE